MNHTKNEKEFVNLKKMLHEKFDNSLNRLINNNIILAIVSTLLLLLCLWVVIFSFIENDFLSYKIFYTIGVGVCIYALIRFFYEMKYLNKIDFSNSIKENLLYINKYEIRNKRGRMIGLCFLLPICFCSMLYGIYEHTLNYGALVGFAAGLGVGLWLYKKIVKKSIQSIKESLVELEELREE